MKILLVVESKHLGNTLKIAKAMAEVAPITITNIENAKAYNFNEFNIVGFGSGIYMGKHDKRLLKFVEGLCDKKAYSFVFSTSGGADFEKNNKTLVNLLTNKNKIVLGTFACKALDKFFILRLMGGFNKGLPNEHDFQNAKDFILGIIKKYELENK
jgi:flavodoxin